LTKEEFVDMTKEERRQQLVKLTLNKCPFLWENLWGKVPLKKEINAAGKSLEIKSYH
jgi:hypothetical protein